MFRIAGVPCVLSGAHLDDRAFAIERRQWRSDSGHLDYSCSARPGRSADHSAEILGPEGGILVGEHVGVDSAEGRLGLVVEAVTEGLDDLFLEAAGARVRADHEI